LLRTYKPPLGGGAVGLVPYRLHGADWSPPNGSVGLPIGNQVVLRFYGPIIWEEQTMPVIVEYRSLALHLGWVDVSDDFVVEAGANARELKVIPTTSLDFDIELEYRVRPRTSSSILCQGVSGNVPVASFESPIETGAW
jgi:hypothetical protein